MRAVSVDDVLVLPRLSRSTAETGVERPIRRIATARQLLEGTGVLVSRPLSEPVSMAEGDPIIFLDHAGPTVNLPGEGNGAPWHPHRGIETVSYVMDGEVSHHDSNGGGGVIAEGDTQWMTAGGGILEDELPTECFYRNGGPMHAVQLWVNLPAALKFSPPRYRAITSTDVCLLTSPDGGALIRLIAGDLGEYHGSGATHTPITYLHATILPGAEVTFPWNPAFNAMAYVLTGRGHGGTGSRPVDERQLVPFRSGRPCDAPGDGDPGPRRRRHGRARLRWPSDSGTHRNLRRVCHEQPTGDRSGDRRLPGRAARHHSRRPARTPKVLLSSPSDRSPRGLER